MNAGPMLTLLPNDRSLRIDAAGIAAAKVELTTLEYRLVEQLVLAKGQMVSREVLHDTLYPHPNQLPTSNVVQVLISRTRRKLRAAGWPKLIRTFRAGGYSLTGAQA